MIASFADRATADHFHGVKFHKKLSSAEQKRATFLLDAMEEADTLKQLQEWTEPPNLRLHLLKHSKKGVWAIDINKVSGWRMTFTWEDESFHDVRIENYH